MIIITGATLVALCTFYNRLEGFKTESSNILVSPNAYSINPVNSRRIT